jgi:guanylate kinase
MLLLRLSGHSGAGKSRLTAALPNLGVTCPRTVLYTSRLARPGEVHGQDYYFLSYGAINALPSSDFFVGPVREMLQGVDLSQLESDLKSNMHWMKQAKQRFLQLRI